MTSALFQGHEGKVKLHIVSIFSVSFYLIKFKECVIVRCVNITTTMRFAWVWFEANTLCVYSIYIYMDLVKTLNMRLFDEDYISEIF